MKKGSIQIDFVIAISIFIAVFAIAIQTTTTFFKNAETTSQSDALTSEADNMLGILDFDSNPSNWSGSENLSRLGISSRVYRFYITVNNTQPSYRNQSQNITNLSNEIVGFSYSNIGFSDVDVNSTVIYDGNTEVPYNINLQNVTFLANVEAGKYKIFIIYFDDDSNFTSRSVLISGSDSLMETVSPVRETSTVQYRKLKALQSSNYNTVKSLLGARNFRIVLTDMKTLSTSFEYGGSLPSDGNVIALYRYTTYQNSTAGVRDGRLSIQVW